MAPRKKEETKKEETNPALELQDKLANAYFEHGRLTAQQKAFKMQMADLEKSYGALDERIEANYEQIVKLEIELQGLMAEAEAE